MMHALGYDLPPHVQMVCVGVGCLLALGAAWTFAGWRD